MLRVLALAAGLAAAASYVDADAPAVDRSAFETSARGAILHKAGGVQFRCPEEVAVGVVRIGLRSAEAGALSLSLVAFDGDLGEGRASHVLGTVEGLSASGPAGAAFHLDALEADFSDHGITLQPGRVYGIVARVEDGAAGYIIGAGGSIVDADPDVGAIYTPTSELAGDYYYDAFHEAPFTISAAGESSPAAPAALLGAGLASLGLFVWRRAAG